jgi:hypothetical protein
VPACPRDATIPQMKDNLSDAGIRAADDMLRFEQYQQHAADPGGS